MYKKTRKKKKLNINKKFCMRLEIEKLSKSLKQDIVEKVPEKFKTMFRILYSIVPNMLEQTLGNNIDNIEYFNNISILINNNLDVELDVIISIDGEEYINMFDYPKNRTYKFYFVFNNYRYFLGTFLEIIHLLK